MSVSGQPERSSRARVGRKAEAFGGDFFAALARQHAVEPLLQGVQVEHVGGA
jgi:hypothetical protein